MSPKSFRAADAFQVSPIPLWCLTSRCCTGLELLLAVQGLKRKVRAQMNHPSCTVRTVGVCPPRRLYMGRPRRPCSRQRAPSKTWLLQGESTTLSSANVPTIQWISLHHCAAVADDVPRLVSTVAPVRSKSRKWLLSPSLSTVSFSGPMRTVCNRAERAQTASPRG